MAAHIRRLLPGALALASLLGINGVVVADETETIRITATLLPAQLEIDVGTTVTWHNRDDDRHRMRSKDGPVRFDSKNLEPGESFSLTFSVEGSYPYYDHRNRDDADYFGMIIVGGEPLDPSAPLPDSAGISIIDKSFRPGSAAIATGGTIEWINDDGEGHTVTATDQAFDSGIMSGGASYMQTFAEPGTYPYFCLIHPEMRGTITVADPIEGDADGSSGTQASETDELVPVAAPTPIAPEPDADLDPMDSATEGAAVSTIDRSFQPGVTEVAVGETVSWANDDTEGHTVTARDGSFNSGIMTVGDEFSNSFDTAGSFDYFCAIHPEMTGTVRVSEPVP